MADTKSKKAKAPKAPKAPKEPAVQGGAEAHMGKAERMKLHLAAQPTVAIMIPLLPGETSGSTESVILNGYRMNIRKGEMVHVPEQVARIIMESMQQTEAAINNYFRMNAEGKSPAMNAKTN